MEDNGWYLKYSGKNFEVVARFTDDETDQIAKLEEALFSAYSDIIPMKRERIHIVRPIEIHTSDTKANPNE